MSDDSLAIDVLYEDAHLLAVNKPGGLLTQAPPGVDCLEYRIRGWLTNQIGGSDRPYLGIPHRLDRPAAGVMLFGRTRDVTRGLSRQFEARTVKKTYWALVEESPSPSHGIWSDFLAKIDGEPRSIVVDKSDTRGQFARLRYQNLMQLERASLIEIHLETGRTHQIRVQTSSRQHAILGDDLYGSNWQFGPQTDDIRKRWIALLARAITFAHPITERRMEVVAPVPECWKEVAGCEPLFT